MTVKLVKNRKEMGYPMDKKQPMDNNQYPPQQNHEMDGAPTPNGNGGGMQQDSEPMLPDHTHPEYDQLLVKVQEIEQAIVDMKMGGVQQESLDSGAPKHDSDKPKDGSKDPENVNAKDLTAVVEMVRRVVREELKGIPERETGKEIRPGGPDNTEHPPMTKQPANGEAPSGGEFDSDDKTNKDSGDEAEGKVPKPSSEFPKMPVKKNKIEQAKEYIEKAKALMKEANEPDPSQPNPGAEEDKPKPMDGAVSPKNPPGGTEVEELGDKASEDPEANVPNDERPQMKETTRQSLVGVSALSSEQTRVAHAEFVDVKTRVNNTVKEFLNKI